MQKADAGSVAYTHKRKGERAERERERKRVVTI